MPAPRRSFTPEYKREAVRLADDLGNAAQAARDLGISAGLIHRGGDSSVRTVTGRSPAMATRETRRSPGSPNF